MSRIRTIKPEWTDDPQLHKSGLAARVLSISLINLADDHGCGIYDENLLAGRVFGYEKDPRGTLRKSAANLRNFYFDLYEVDNQTYFSIRNWGKHQRIDNAGKRRVPGPEAVSYTHLTLPTTPYV